MSGTTTDRDTYVAANRAAWNASAEHHRGNRAWRDLVAGFATPGHSCLDEIDIESLTTIGVSGKDVAQICCNNGRELLSIRNMGAARCVGFDQSHAFLDQARELTAIAGQDCEFVEGDVYHIPADYDGCFHLVVITIGVFGWMPALPSFFAVVARLLRPGGQLYVYEEHPVMNMFDPATARPFEPANAYFRTEPEAANHAIVYDGAQADQTTTHYWFFHTLSDVLTACLENGLTIERFREYAHNISNVEFDIYEDRGVAMPMSYTLVARKPA